MDKITYEDALLWLVTVPNMGYKKIKRLLEYFQIPEHIYTASEKILLACKCIKEQDVGHIMESRKDFNPEEERKKLEQQKIIFITERQEEFPAKLKYLPDGPKALFVKGKELRGLNHPSAAIIGARVCSHYGWNTAKRLAGELAEQGICIISGMARGVDSAAHKGAMESGGITYAVLGCGVDICYPPENRLLYDRIQEQGALISEYPPGRRPNAWQFPERNRLIAGMSGCVVITEAKEKSGSLITARYALDQGVDVCAVPGRIDDPLSCGCNRLIREGAYPAIEVSDILFTMGISQKNKGNSKIVLEKRNEVVYSVLCFYPQSVDEISEKTGMESGELYDILLQLQLAGLVEEPVKNYYIKK